jgi:hypothetical protein
MSNEKQASPLPNLEDASSVFEQIYAETFFNKLASFGIQPETEAEAIEWLKIGHQVQQLEPQVKQANADQRRGLAFEVGDALQGILTEAGVGKEAEQREHNAEIYNVAQALAQDPDVYNAALSLKTAQAQQWTEAVQQEMAGKASE